jgi:hypothetical protein
LFVPFAGRVTFFELFVPFAGRAGLVELFSGNLIASCSLTT